MRDMVWQDDRVAELVYDLAPRPKQFLTPGCRMKPTPPAAAGPRTTCSRKLNRPNTATAERLSETA